MQRLPINYKELNTKAKIVQRNLRVKNQIPINKARINPRLEIFTVKVKICSKGLIKAPKIIYKVRNNQKQRTDFKVFKNILVKKSSIRQSKME